MGRVGCGPNTAFTPLMKALTECVRPVLVLHFDNIYNKFSLCLSHFPHWVIHGQSHPVKQSRDERDDAATEIYNHCGNINVWSILSEINFTSTCVKTINMTKRLHGYHSFAIQCYRKLIIYQTLKCPEQSL